MNSSEKETITEAVTLGAEMVNELIRKTPEEFEYLRLVLLAETAGRPRSAEYVNSVFKVAKARRPLLIEMRD